MNKIINAVSHVGKLAVYAVVIYYVVFAVFMIAGMIAVVALSPVFGAVLLFKIFL